MTSIITVVMGFFVICAGVVLLQLSKSAKDVPDAAVFAGDLNQMRTIAEQEQPESEPKADAIRGTAAIVRRFSTTRQKMEEKEAKRLHEERLADLQPISENEQVEWDGLRRRRTTIGSRSMRSARTTTPFPAYETTTVQPPTPHPPLGMSHFPDEDSEDEERPNTANTGVSLFSRAKSFINPARLNHNSQTQQDVQSPMHPVPLTQISLPASKNNNAYYGDNYGLPPQDHETEYQGAGGERHITIADDPRSLRHGAGGSSHLGPTPPPHSAHRQFSFQNVFRKGQPQNPENNQPQSRSPMIRKGLGQRKSSGGAAVKGATEEERLGLVKGDTHKGREPQEPEYAEDYDEDETDEDWSAEDKLQHRQSPDRAPRRDLTPPRRDKDESPEKWTPPASGKHPQGKLPPPPPFEDKGSGGAGAFI